MLADGKYFYIFAIQAFGCENQIKNTFESILKFINSEIDSEALNVKDSKSYPDFICKL